VEQVQQGALREQRGEPDALAFAARERGHVAPGHRCDVEAGERRQRRRPVGRGIAQPAAGARLAREHHGLQGVEPEGRLEGLRQQAAHAGQAGDVVVTDRPPGEEQGAAARREQAGDGGDETALAGAVRADHAPELAGRDDPVEGTEQAAAVGRMHHGIAPLDQGAGGLHRRARLRTSSARKTGTPTRETIAPTGSWVGATTVRASVSASTTSAPPASTQAGSSVRWSLPSARRSVCGTISPTNPTAPAVVTAKPAASAASRQVASRRRVTSTPSEKARASPSSIRLSEGASRIAASSPATRARPGASQASAPARSPISQKSMPRRRASGATLRTSVSSAPQPEASMTPASRMRRGAIAPWAGPRLAPPAPSVNSSSVETAAPTQAAPVTRVAPAPAHIART